MKLPEWTKQVFPKKMLPLAQLMQASLSWNKKMKRFAAGKSSILLIRILGYSNFAVTTRVMSPPQPRDCLSYFYLFILFFSIGCISTRMAISSHTSMFLLLRKTLNLTLYLIVSLLSHIFIFSCLID